MISSRARLDIQRAETELATQELVAQSDAFCQQMQSLQPELISTLRNLGNQQLAGELTKNLAPLAILGGDSVADVASRLLDRLPLFGAKTDIQALLRGPQPAEGGQREATDDE